MGAKKPIASLCILFYNQEKFVKDAVEGALSQTFDDCEIILSDDHSTDRTLELIKDVVSNYHGNKTIIINENDHNLGLVPHVNKIIFEKSHGDFILLTGGDDISLPNRVDDTVRLFYANPKISMVTLSAIIIDEQGLEMSRHLSDNELTYYTDKEYLRSTSLGAGNNAMAYRRDVLLTYGPLSNDCQTEDSTLRFRSILQGPILSSNIIGLKYRIHNNNISIGNRVYKLKSHEIAEQYRRDLAKQKGNMPISLYNLLCKKINYYEDFREISFKQTKITNNILDKYRFRLLHLLLRKIYHFNIEIYNLKK